MSPHNKTPSKLTGFEKAEARRCPPFTRFDQRGSATTADFDAEHMGIAPKE